MILDSLSMRSLRTVSTVAVALALSACAASAPPPPVSAPSAVEGMELPAVAARVEGPRGRVIYRNEVAVLLKSGAAGDIPMTLQRVQAASSGTAKTWDTPSVE